MKWRGEILKYPGSYVSTYLPFHNFTLYPHTYVSYAELNMFH
jgi:hypothetical protein